MPTVKLNSLVRSPDCQNQPASFAVDFRQYITHGSARTPVSISPFPHFPFLLLGQPGGRPGKKKKDKITCAIILYEVVQKSFYYWVVLSMHPEEYPP